MNILDKEGSTQPFHTIKYVQNELNNLLTMSTTKKEGNLTKITNVGEKSIEDSINEITEYLNNTQDYHEYSGLITRLLTISKAKMNAYLSSIENLERIKQLINKRRERISELETELAHEKNSLIESALYLKQIELQRKLK